MSFVLSTKEGKAKAFMLAESVNAVREYFMNLAIFIC